MIKEFTFTNFKAFKEKQVIPVKPITLIFGENGAGKSSVLQSLLWTAGAVQSKTLEFGSRDLEDDGIDLGSFANVPFRKSGTDLIKIELNLEEKVSVTFEVGYWSGERQRKSIDGIVPPKEMKAFHEAKLKLAETESRSRDELIKGLWKIYGQKKGFFLFPSKEAKDFQYNIVC